MKQVPEADSRSGPHVWLFFSVLGSFSTGAVVGAVIWWVSPYFGKVEPWHVMYGIPYLILMFVWGFVLALPVRFNWAFSGPLGLYMGQLVYTNFFCDPGGPIGILPAFLSLGIFGMPPALAGCVIGLGARFAL